MTNVNVNDSMKLAELLKTPICKMDGEELAFLITSITSPVSPRYSAAASQQPAVSRRVASLAKPSRK